MPMLRVKMRPDTPGQDYQNVNVHDIELDGPGKVISFELTHGTKVAPKPPRALIKNVTVSNIKGTFGSFGKIAANANTDISGITLKNINVKVKTATLDTTGVKDLTIEDVIVNDTPFAASQPSK